MGFQKIQSTKISGSIGTSMSTCSCCATLRTNILPGKKLAKLLIEIDCTRYFPKKSRSLIKNFLGV